MVAHVNTEELGGLIPAKGGTIVWVMMSTSVSVHPFTLFVAVTVYVPGAVTGNMEAVPTTAAPLDQE